MENVRCSICGKEEAVDVKEEWRLDSGEIVTLSHSDVIFVDDPKHRGKVICEDCYNTNSLHGYNDVEFSEIHMGFGHSYSHAKRYMDAEKAFDNAVKLRSSADALAHLALCRNRLGDKEAAISLYKSALKLDSDHFMALQNLSKLLAE